MKKTIEDFFTRPHRQTYFPYDLGPHFFSVNEKKVVRHDQSISNGKEVKMQLSFYEYDADCV